MIKDGHPFLVGTFIEESMLQFCTVPSVCMKILSSEADVKLPEAYDEFHDAIFRHCYFHTFDRELAKDVLQEAFVKTWEYLAAGNDIDNVRAFLYRVATNLIINGVRKKKETSLDALQEEGFDPGADDDMHKRDFVQEERVMCMLKKIEEPYRTAVTMRYIEGLSPAEIADVTGETPNVISVRIHRGLKQLESHLGHE